MKTKKPKALVLLSGGLDSRLACKILEEQLGRENMEAVFFILPFGGGCCNDVSCVFRFCQTQNLKLHVIDCTKGGMFRKYMEIIKKPKFQRGVALNPCIDCHVFMLGEAKKLAGKTGADIIATGEVLGERPLSQNRHALSVVEKAAGLEGKLLRPLSARLLPETEAEKNKWIDRSRLLDIKGRGRKRQIALAKKYRISFPSPGGGCLLTDREFSKRLSDLLKHEKNPTPDEIELLKMGRHFRSGKTRIIVGRNRKENTMLIRLARKMKLPYMEAKDYMGPDTIIHGRQTKTGLQRAASLTARYSDAPENKQVEIVYIKGKTKKILKAKGISQKTLEKTRV